MGVIKGDTRSLDYCSYKIIPEILPTTNEQGSFGASG